jgi:hypothetical protein
VHYWGTLAFAASLSLFPVLVVAFVTAAATALIVAIALLRTSQSVDVGEASDTELVVLGTRRLGTAHELE